MQLTAKIKNRITKLPQWKTFGYIDLNIDKDEYQTAAKVLERLQKNGFIKKLSKGVFYKPEQTLFGDLQPDYNNQLQQYLYKNGKRIGYETGTSLYNRLGLTTQIAFRIKIASRSNRISINCGAIKADAVKSYAEVTEANYELLGFLDAFKDIKRIPDSSVTVSIKILAAKINNLNDKQTSDLVKYALLYPPRVRALVGAVLESVGKTVSIQKLKDSLNPLTKFELNIKETDLPVAKNWSIV